MECAQYTSLCRLSAQAGAGALFHVKHLGAAPALQVQALRFHRADERLAAQGLHGLHQGLRMRPVQLGAQVIQQHDARALRMIAQVADLGQQQACGQQFLLAAGSHPCCGLAVQQQAEVRPVRAPARGPELPFLVGRTLQRLLQGPALRGPAPVIAHGNIRFWQQLAGK